MSIRLLILVAIVWLLGGCQTTGPEVVQVEAGSYLTAFDAAIEAARGQGMVATLRNPREGVIETDASLAGSALEPWRDTADSPRQTTENTLHLQRRRVRFEFTPLEALPATEAGGSEPLNNPPTLDLTRHAGPLELHASVFIERAYRPGTQPDTWSSRVDSEMRIPDGTDRTIDHAQPFWVTVGRDQAMERRLLARIEALISVE